MNFLRLIFNNLTLNKSGDTHALANLGCTLGVVVDTDDPLQMGRLRIYCPELNDDPKKVQHLPWASYVSPFGGSIRNPSHTKGHQDGASTPGTSQYGFWGVPELGANVLVTCINGDPRKRVWLGCLYEHQEAGGLFHGVYNWSSGKADGPYYAPRPKMGEEENYDLEAEKQHKMQPLYDNLSKAFKDERDSSEWKTRGADYSTAVNVAIDSYGTNAELSSGEKDSWVKEKLGAMGYDWSSFKNLGAFLASKVIGLMSPGLHAISLDDRPFNSRIRIRTTAGHQIILDDTNERIYVSTYEGNSWVELDKNGNIDVFSDRRISMRAKKDINFSTDESFRVKAKGGIFMYAGDSRGQTPLESVPANGQIRFHSENDTHFFTQGDFYQTINGNMDFNYDGNVTGMIGGSFNLQMGTDSYNILTPASAMLISGGKFQVQTGTADIVGTSKVQLVGGSSAVEVSGSKITLDAPTIAFSEYGTTVGIMVGGINEALACCPTLPLVPVPQFVTPDTVTPPTFEILETEIAPWTNRVPDHEPWPRVMKQDSDDTVDEPNEGYKNNVDWTDQFSNEGEKGRKDIGVIEGEDDNRRGEFWRR